MELYEKGKNKMKFKTQGHDRTRSPKKKTETKGTILHGAQDARHIRD